MFLCISATEPLRWDICDRSKCISFVKIENLMCFYSTLIPSCFCCSDSNLKMIGRFRNELKIVQYDQWFLISNVRVVLIKTAFYNMFLRGKCLCKTLALF